MLNRNMNKIAVLFAGTVIILMAACGGGRQSHSQNDVNQKLNWYRGNTHSHTSRTVGTAESPDVVAAWYLKRGYHFLCLTDHNVLTDPSTVTLPLGARKDFILIPSEEIHTETLHANALNIQRPIPPPSVGITPGMLQQCLDETEKASGILIANHPNYQWTIRASDLRSVSKLKLFELYNSHPMVQNEGDATHASTEAIWDSLLSDGKKIFGVASDDSHVYPTRFSSSISGPGRGWVMVQAQELTAAAIASALSTGQFYSSIGVLLSKVELNPLRILIEIDKSATEAELSLGSAFGRPAPQGSKVGERIDFIGTGGKILASVEGRSAYFTPRGRGYVRGRATVTRLIDGRLIEFCAWTQPVFID